MPYVNTLPLSSNIKGSAQLRTPCFNGMPPKKKSGRFISLKDYRHMASAYGRGCSCHPPIGTLACWTNTRERKADFRRNSAYFFGTPDLESQRIANLKASIGENTIKPLRRFDKSIFPLFFKLLGIPQPPFYKTEWLGFTGLNWGFSDYFQWFRNVSAQYLRSLTNINAMRV